MGIKLAIAQNKPETYALTANPLTESAQDWPSQVIVTPDQAFETPTPASDLPTVEKTLPPTPIPWWTPPAVERTGLAVLDPWSVVAAPQDPNPQAMPDGLLVAPTDPSGAVLWDAPEGKPFAILPVEYYEGESKYPVIAQTRQFYQVLVGARRGLPSKVGSENVNGATGWVLKTDVTTSSTDYAITVDLSDESVVITKAGEPVFTTHAGVGKASSPTPVTRTYIMSVYSDPSVRYTPYFVALATHSAVLDSFKGGPAPTAIHTDSVTRGKVSNGCIRVPRSALDKFKDLPLGTPVVILP